MARGSGAVRTPEFERAMGAARLLRSGANLSDDHLLAYRREVSKIDASLPQRAGKALTKWRMREAPLAAYREHSHSPTPGTKRSRDYAVTVFSLVQPEIDPQKITRAVMAAFDDYREATSESGRGVETS